MPPAEVCPYCGNNKAKRIYKVTPNAVKKIRIGLSDTGHVSA